MVVRNGPARCAPAAHASATPTASVDNASPANARSQNGSTSRHTSLASRLPHVQRRLSLYDGTVATAVAKMLAAHAAIPSPAVATTNVVKQMTVLTTDTLMHRVSR